MAEHHHFEGRARADSAEIAFRKIFIGGLSYSTDEEKLKKYFKIFGNVQDAVVMKDPVTKRSRGFGFITFYDVGSVDNVLANEPHTIDGRKVEAKRAVPRSEMNKDLQQQQPHRPAMNNGMSSLASAHSASAINKPLGSAPGTPLSSPQVLMGKSMGSSTPLGTMSTSSSGMHPMFDTRHATDPRINSEEFAYNKIFVGGLHYDTRDAEFRAYFEHFGRVISAEVMFNRETHKSRGFGFIIFEIEDSAINACSEREHIINGKAVEVKRAIPRSKMGSPNGTPLASSSNDAMSSYKYMSPNGDMRARSKSEAPMPVSSNTSTLTASFASGNGASAGLNGSVSNGSPAGFGQQRKIANLALSSRPISYANALKAGAPMEDFFANSSNSALLNSQSTINAMLSPRDAVSNGSSVGNNDTSGSLFGSSVLSLFSSNNESSALDALLTNRTSRAFSEPIVRMDPLIDFSSFGRPSGGAGWLESDLQSNAKSNGSPSSSNNGPPSPEAWSRLINSLSADGGAGAGAGAGGGSASEENDLSDSTSPQYYTMLNDEVGTERTSSAVDSKWSARRHSDPLLTGLGFPTDGPSVVMSSGFVESVPMRARSASRDENGSLVLGITQQARNSRANSFTEMDLLQPLQSQAQRRLSHPADQLLEALSGPLGEFSLNGSRSRTNSGDIWGQSVGLR